LYIKFLYNFSQVLSSSLEIRYLCRSHSLKALEQVQLDLLTNATVVDDAIRFESQESKEKLKSSMGNSNEDDNKQSNEPDYDEDRDQLEEEQEDETGEMTINQVF
jgi:hypothetical protein